MDKQSSWEVLPDRALDGEKTLALSNGLSSKKARCTERLELLKEISTMGLLKGLGTLLATSAASFIG